MTNCVEELFYNLKGWLNPKYTTYGNPENTFSGRKYAPIMYDYIFRRTNSPKKVTSWTSWFELPLFKAKIAKPHLYSSLLQNIDRDPMPFKAYESVYNLQHGRTNVTTERKTENIARSKRSMGQDEEATLISFSDHEAVASTIYIWA